MKISHIKHLVFLQKDNSNLKLILETIILKSITPRISAFFSLLEKAIEEKQFLIAS